LSFQDVNLDRKQLFGKIAKFEISGEKYSLKNGDFIKVDGLEDIDRGPWFVVGSPWI